MKSTAHIVLFVIMGLSIVAGRGVRGQEGDPADLPVSRVVLFRSGVGYFQHSGKIAGETDVRLMFKTDQINDVLKSMILMDPGGGAQSVTYPSRQPLERALKSFGVDLSGSPDRVALLRQVRGAEVVVWAPNQVKGKVMGVETHKRQVVTGGQPVVTEQAILNLLTPDGLKAIPLKTIDIIELQDGELRAEMNKALELLISSRDTERKPVDIAFSGEGERSVIMGYVTEAPVWKTAYRLDLSGREPRLQGWAIVENTTDRDWKGVRLSLVSGRPVSFVMDLYTPLFAPRPVVQPEVYAGLQPPKYAEGLRKQKAAGRARGREARAATRSVDSTEGLTREIVPPRIMNYPDRRFWTDIAAAATTAEVGELFRFDIKEPVNLKRRGSAMLPIVADAVEASRVSIYNQEQHAEHPMNGAWLTNTTGKKLPGGPITVFDGGTYAGDARVGTLVPGERRLIAHALDLKVTVDPSERSTSELLSGKIVRGVLQMEQEHRYHRIYRIKNKAEGERQVLVEHPFRAGHELVQPEEYAEKTQEHYRFQVPVPAGETTELVVEERLQRSQTVKLIDQGSGRLQLYIQTAELSADVRAALEELAEMKRKLDELQSERNRAQQERNSILTGQSRLRKNLQVVGKESELGRRYLKKLADQEDRIEQLEARVQELQGELDAQNQAIRDFLADLEVR